MCPEKGLKSFVPYVVNQSSSGCENIARKKANTQPFNEWRRLNLRWKMNPRKRDIITAKSKEWETLLCTVRNSISLNIGANKTSKSGIRPAMPPISKAFLPMCFSFTKAKVVAPRRL